MSEFGNLGQSSDIKAKPKKCMYLVFLHAFIYKYIENYTSLEKINELIFWEGDGVEAEQYHNFFILAVFSSLHLAVGAKSNRYTSWPRKHFIYFFNKNNLNSAFGSAPC